MEPLIKQAMLHPAKLISVFKHTVSPSSSGFLTIHPATYPVAPVIKGAFFTVQKALPHLNEDASVIFTTSTLDEKGMPGMSVYSATKAAVRSMTRTLAAELAPRKIRVNSIAPGPIETPIYERMGLPAEAMQEMAQTIVSQVTAGKVEPRQLLLEAVRVTRPGGRVILTSYAPQFWPHRLEWFQTQADHGLLGEIDYQATGDGVIVCTNGFKATTFSMDDLKKLASLCKVEAHIYTIDNSSVVFEVRVASLD